MTENKNTGMAQALQNLVEKFNQDLAKVWYGDDIPQSELKEKSNVENFMLKVYNIIVYSLVIGISWITLILIIPIIVVIMGIKRGIDILDELYGEQE